MSEYNSDNNNKHESANQPSWIVIGICLLVFWPVGLVLLIKRLGFELSAHSASIDAKKDQWQQDWHAQSDKWRHNWRSGKWGRDIANFVDSLFNSGDDSSGTAAPPEGYYSQSEPPTGNLSQPYSGTSASQQSRQSNQTHNRKSQAQHNAQPVSKTKSATANARSMSSQRAGKGLSIALSLLGVVLGLGGIVLMSLGASQYVVYGLSVANLLVFILGVFCLLGGFSCFITRNIITARMNRFKQYAVIVGNKDIIAISDISRLSGDSEAKASRTLQLMINAGLFGPEAYIDKSLDSLVRSYSAAKAEYGNRSANTQPDSKKANEGSYYVAIINELHMLCVKTSDPAICAKIQTIKDLTAKIFRTVEDHPEKKPQIRRFINFYLPTTIKLLHSYETLEKQGVDGGNIQSAKKDIERILDTLITGFEQQLDHLFMSDKLDISSDIDVLENLMQQDGLTTESQIFKTAGGN